MEDGTEEKTIFWTWKTISAAFLLFFGCTSFVLGTEFYVFEPSRFFHINEQFQQSKVLDKIHKHVVSASTSHSVTVVEQQLTEADTEIKRYMKAQPLVEISGTDFENWYRSISGVKHQLNLAEQVENSNASPFQKLQADKMALDSLKDFAEIKLTNSFGATLGVEYKAPSSIPLKLNSLETAITSLYWVLSPIKIASIFLAAILVSDDIEELYDFFNS